jgi:hypothetical protein
MGFKKKKVERLHRDNIRAYTSWYFGKTLAIWHLLTLKPINCSIASSWARQKGSSQPKKAILILRFKKFKILSMLDHYSFFPIYRRRFKHIND